MMMRFKDSPEPPAPGMVPPGSDNKIMHLCMRIGDANVMASDGHCTGQTSFQGFSLSLTAADEADAKRKFTALAEGGQFRCRWKDFLVALLRHGRRPFRRRLDGDGSSVTGDGRSWN